MFDGRKKWKNKVPGGKNSGDKYGAARGFTGQTVETLTGLIRWDLDRLVCFDDFFLNWLCYSRHIYVAQFILTLSNKLTNSEKFVKSS